MPREPYKKLLDIPLRAPDTSVPLMSKQLPENVIWLPDGRGFKKRPGSLPFAFSAVNDGQTNFVCALSAVQTPASRLIGFEDQGGSMVRTAGDRVLESETLLAYRWGAVTYGPVILVDTAPFDTWGTSFSYTSYAKYGVFQLDSYRAFLLSRASDPVGGVQALTRARSDRTDASYYYGNPNSSLEIGPGVAVTDVQATALPSALSYNEAGQQGIPASLLRPEPLNPQKDYFSLAYKPYTVSVQNTDGAKGSQNTPRNSINTARIDMVSTEEGAFIGGGGGPVLYYDGARTDIAGPVSLGLLPSLQGNDNLGNSVNGAGGPFINAPTVGAAGALTGVFKYAIQHRYTLPSGETVGGALVEIGSVTLAAQKATITGYSQALFWEYMYRFQDAGDTITLYRTKAGGSTYYVRDSYSVEDLYIADGNSAVTLLQDELADSSLTETYIAPAYTTNPSPAITHGIALHQGRLVTLAGSYNELFQDVGLNPYINQSFPISYGVTENSDIEPVIQNSLPRVVFSPASSYHYFPVENSFNIPAPGQKPMGLVSVNDTLYVFMSNSIYYVSGTLGDVGGYTVNQLTDQLGCRDPRSIIKVGTTVYFMSQNGLVALNGTALDFDLAKPVRRLVLEPGVVTASYYWKSKNLLLISASKMTEYRTGDPDTNYHAEVNGSLTAKPYRYYATGGRPRTLVLDLISNLWSIWDIECFNGATEFNGDLICAPSLPHPGFEGAEVWFTRYSDNCNWTDSGRPFIARYYSEWFDNGMPLLDKQFNRMVLFSNDTTEAGGQSFNLSIHTERDWMPGVRLQDWESEDFNTPGYGAAPYGSQPYGDPSKPYKVLPLSNQKVKSLRVVLENNEPNGDFCINAMALETTDTYDNSKDS